MVGGAIKKNYGWWALNKNYDWVVGGQLWLVGNKKLWLVGIKLKLWLV